MIYLLFVISTLLAIWCGYNKNKLARDGRRITAAFVSSAFPFLISLAVVSGSFAITATLIYLVDEDSATFDSLYQVETGIHSLYRMVSSLKLGTWTSVSLLAVLWLVAVIGAGASEKSRESPLGRGLGMLSSIFSKYSKGIAWVFTLLSVLCSFTFFAGAVEPGLRRLQLRLKTAKQTIVELGAGLSHAFSDEVERELLENIKKNAPQEVVNGLRRMDHLEIREIKLKREYEARPLFGAEGQKVEKILSRKAALNEALTTITRPREIFQSKIGFEIAPAVTLSTLASIKPTTLKSLDNALTHMSEKSVQPSGKRETAQGRNLTEKFVGGLVELGIKDLDLPFNELVRELPLAEPLLEVFKGGMSKLATSAFDKKDVKPHLDRITISAQSGDALHIEDALRREATRFVDEKGEVKDRWREYMSRHPGRLYEEQQSLDRWEKEIEAAHRYLEGNPVQRKVPLEGEVWRRPENLASPKPWLEESPFRLPKTTQSLGQRDSSLALGSAAQPTEAFKARQRKLIRERRYNPRRTPRFLPKPMRR